VDVNVVLAMWSMIRGVVSTRGRKTGAGDTVPPLGDGQAADVFLKKRDWNLFKNHRQQLGWEIRDVVDISSSVLRIFVGGGLLAGLV
jgi:hypothetical protein